MEPNAELSGDAKLKALIRHLVTTFPHAAILSRQVEETYHLFIIVPYGGAPEKSIQVERALLLDRNLSVHKFVSLLERLKLPTLSESVISTTSVLAGDQPDLRADQRSNLQSSILRALERQH